jgi:hypothetical protein
MNQSSELLTPVHALSLTLKRVDGSADGNVSDIWWVLTCPVNFFAIQARTPEEALEEFARMMRFNRTISVSGQPFDNRLRPDAQDELDIAVLEKTTTEELVDFEAAVAAYKLDTE